MIENVQIYGERNSGTNYLEELLRKNLDGNLKIGFDFGWKHWFPNLKMINSSNIMNVLFIFITKDPYSWLVSMNRKPHHAPQLYNLEFSDFIRRPWACYKGMGYEKRALKLKEEPLQDHEEMLHERNPDTGERYSNIMLLRNAKNKSFLNLSKIVNNFEHIRYEDLLDNPGTIISGLAIQYNLKLRGEFTNTTGYHGHNPKLKFDGYLYYNERKYLKYFTDADLKYINYYLNWNIETVLGYEKFYL